MKDKQKTIMMNKQKAIMMNKQKTKKAMATKATKKATIMKNMMNKKKVQTLRKTHY